MDNFYQVELCQRCRAILQVRTQSWFNNDVICTSCSIEEKELRATLRHKFNTDMEGCDKSIKEIRELCMNNAEKFILKG